MAIERGERLPIVALPDTKGELIPLARFRGQLSLALFLAGDGSERAGLAPLIGIELELRAWGAQTVLVVANAAQEAEELRQEFGFAGYTLLDLEGALHRRLGAVDAAGRPQPALLIADRGGELSYRVDFPHVSAEALHEAVDWARYLGIQEPECGCCSVAEGWASLTDR
jgi:peroxiredoxin